MRQLYRHLRELILTRRLAAGARLPSTRKLARDLDVSRTVTLDAFGQLAAEGFLETRRGAGHFVADSPLAGGNSIRRAWSSRQRRAGARPFEPARPSVRSRLAGRRPVPAAGVEPDARARVAPPSDRRRWSAIGRASRRFAQALATHLHALRGVALTPDQVMVTAGSADVLPLIARSTSHQPTRARCAPGSRIRASASRAVPRRRGRRGGPGARRARRSEVARASGWRRMRRSRWSRRRVNSRSGCRSACRAGLALLDWARRSRRDHRRRRL